jgi:hypothetical protein
MMLESINRRSSSTLRVSWLAQERLDYSTQELVLLFSTSCSAMGALVHTIKQQAVATQLFSSCTALPATPVKVQQLLLTETLLLTMLRRAAASAVQQLALWIPSWQAQCIYCNPSTGQ